MGIFRHVHSQRGNIKYVYVIGWQMLYRPNPASAKVKTHGKRGGEEGRAEGGRKTDGGRGQPGGAARSNDESQEWSCLPQEGDSRNATCDSVPGPSLATPASRAVGQLF